MKVTKASLSDLRRLHAEAAQRDAMPPAQRRPRKSRQATPQTGPEPGTGAAARPLARNGAPASPAAEPPAAPQPLALLDATDLALFRQAMRFVQPLRRHDLHAPGHARRDPEPLLRARREHAQGQDAAAAPPVIRGARRAVSPLDPEADAYLQPGCGPDLLRGLRRGKWIPQATLDLHGSTAEQAHERLDRFLASCLAHDIRCVRIIHGKGIGSRAGEPVLKAAVRLQLGRLAVIQAWVQCTEADGGAGAVTALLRMPANHRSVS